jgi:septal ring factor EnvC (AmiA/AmiB activator)
MSGFLIGSRTVDYRDALDIALAVACSAVGLWVKSISEKNTDRKNDHDRLSHDFNTLHQTVTNMRESIPQRYATLEDLNDTTARVERANRELAERQDKTNERIFSTLTRIETKLDQKGAK